MSKDRQDHTRPEPACAELAALADRLTPIEGVNLTLLDDVTLLRRSRSIPRRPVLHEPSIVFVVQGRKRGFIAGHRFRYDERTILVLSAPIPFECISETPRDKALLAVYVRLRKEVILDILASMKAARMLTLPLKAIEETALDEELSNAFVRLLKTLTAADDTRVLGTQIVRELIYLVLRRKEGDGVRAMVESDGHVAQIYRSLQRIDHEFQRPLEVKGLARQAGMSVSTYHLRFKQVTLTSPVQYLKAIRMHKARALILDSQMPAGVAALRVGYKSASQFGREFKRFFGTTPAKLAAGKGAHAINDGTGEQ